MSAEKNGIRRVPTRGLPIHGPSIYWPESAAGQLERAQWAVGWLQAIWLEHHRQQIQASARVAKRLVKLIEDVRR